MIAKSIIQKNLLQLNKLYIQSSGKKKGRNALYFSKLALIELCGWIEESMDSIIYQCASRHIIDKSSSEFIKDIIARTYGFRYDADFRDMLIKLIGIINVENLEDKLNQNKFHILKSTLGTLTISRNNHAHTYIKGVTIRIDAPSVTINHFSKVYEGLEDINKCIRKIHL